MEAPTACSTGLSGIGTAMSSCASPATRAREIVEREPDGRVQTRSWEHVVLLLHKRVRWCGGHGRATEGQCYERRVHA
eukprot:1789579-Prymnesium_polylepis.1